MRTIGSQPTSRPPAYPRLFRKGSGKFASRAYTGYPMVDPKDESFVLSA